ncbi:MAG: LOG family protein, partial [Candidatus Peribacteraceae bacterium]
WAGGGPGLMEAALLGVKTAGGRIAAIKIHLTAEQSEHEQEISSVLDPRDVAECEYFGPRKIGLVDAGMLQNETDHTAFVVLPGGFGTMDELFEEIVLKQLKKNGSKHPVPILLINYNGYYDNLLKQMDRMEAEGTVTAKERELITICNSNEEALEALADFYAIEPEQRTYKGKMQQWKWPQSETLHEQAV